MKTLLLILLAFLLLPASTAADTKDCKSARKVEQKARAVYEAARDSCYPADGRDPPCSDAEIEAVDVARAVYHEAIRDRRTACARLSS